MKNLREIFKPKYTKGYLFVLLLLLFSPASSQTGRMELGINSNWSFTKDNIDPSGNVLKANWQKISIPHTWNDKDVIDDTPGYYRGTCWYKKNLSVDKSYVNKQLYIYFEGVNQEAEVFINGKSAGTHTGGYTRFSFLINQYIDFSPEAQNTIIVKVNNRYNENIPPLSADFTFFGGIYRDVKLVIIDAAVHFSMNDGANGVFITTPSVSAKAAIVNVRSMLQNSGATSSKLNLLTQIKSVRGEIVVEKRSSVELKQGETRDWVQTIDNISNPQLWSPETPYLYTVVTKITDKAGKVLDQVSNPLGLRWFRFDPAKGFYLNDKPYKLMGASRHQDFKEIGNALPDSYHLDDILRLKNMGANFIRVAHYPQDPVVLEACDRLGLVASVEIPIVNAITETEEFTRNCVSMQLEMIRQNYNHPSVVMWVYMNEVFLRPKFNGQQQRQQEYFTNIAKLAQHLEDVTRKEDPSRYTMIPNYGYYELHKKYNMINIPKIVGWNLYQGWYSGTLEDFGNFLDRCHQDYPDKPVMVTEYGADADPRIHALQPEKFDKSIEYSLNFHEYYLREINKRDFVSGAVIWSLADFSSEAREETMPHINNKGLFTIGREPKDLYHYYQSQLLKTPFIKLSNWNKRSGIADSAKLCSTQSMDVFSNAGEVELLVNGQSLGKIISVSGKRFTWQVPFVQGINKVEAIAKFGERVLRDVSEVEFNVILPDNIATQYNQLNVLLGAKRIFIEEDSKQVWIPAKEYRNGSWGYIGGKPFKLAGNTRQSYGTDRGIYGTNNDPIYQTQQVGIEKFKLDVNDGEYELVLHFSELLSGETKEALAYNLDNTNRVDQAENRIFDVSVNAVPFIQKLNIRSKYGALRPGFEKAIVKAENGKGIEIIFTPIIGLPVLNALQLRKLN